VGEGPGSHGEGTTCCLTRPASLATRSVGIAEALPESTRSVPGFRAMQPSGDVGHLAENTKTRAMAGDAAAAGRSPPLRFLASSLSGAAGLAAGTTSMSPPPGWSQRKQHAVVRTSLPHRRQNPAHASDRAVTSLLTCSS
jgi:hypothetical protein